MKLKVNKRGDRFTLKVSEHELGALYDSISTKRERFSSDEAHKTAINIDDTISDWV